MSDDDKKVEEKKTESKWSGWRLPTPHEVMFALVAIATVIVGLHALPAGSIAETIAQVTEGVGGLLGISLAAKHLPVHVQEVLAVHDERVKVALAAMPEVPVVVPVAVPVPVPPAAGTP